MAKKQDLCELFKRFLNNPEDEFVVESLKKLPRHMLREHHDNCGTCEDGLTKFMGRFAELMEDPNRATRDKARRTMGKVLAELTWL